MVGRLEGKVAVITGATSGLGRHAALHLAKEGHHVIATGRNQLALQTLREEGSDVAPPFDFTCGAP